MLPTRTQPAGVLPEILERRIVNVRGRARVSYNNILKKQKQAVSNIRLHSEVQEVACTVECAHGLQFELELRIGVIRQLEKIVQVIFRLSRRPCR